MPEQSSHESAPEASAVDAALTTSREAVRAAELAVDYLETAKRSSKVVERRRWRIAAFSTLQDVKVRATRAMQQMADAAPNDMELRNVRFADVLAELEVYAALEGSLVGGEALRRAASRLVAKFGGAR